MCTYTTEKVALGVASAKGKDGWFSATEATVYFDHPVHAALDHSLNIDLIDSSSGLSKRVGIEMDKESARRLANAIMAAIGTAETLGL